MQKIEKWRLEELALVLDRLSELLRKGDHCEWANVFHHFHEESQKILSKKEFDLDSLKRLVRNIKDCFQGVSSLKNLVLGGPASGEGRNVNHDFQRGRARLLKILEDMDKRTIEFIN